MPKCQRLLTSYVGRVRVPLPPPISVRSCSRSFRKSNKTPRSGRSMTPRQYGRLVSDWLIGMGLAPHLNVTHSLRQKKATLIYRRTANPRAVKLLLGHTKIESTVLSLGIDVF